MNRIISKALVISLAWAGSTFPTIARAECNEPGFGAGEVTGTLLGAAVGGFLGSKVGKGDGNKVAIAVGVLGGGLLGKSLGANLDCKDQHLHAETANQAFESQPTGTTSSWVNPDTGHQGTITPTRTFATPQGQNCRDFQQTIVVDGKPAESTGTACRTPEGAWEVLAQP